MNNIIIKNIEHYKDERGFLASIWKEDYWNKFLEDRISISKKGVIRGFHGDKKTEKLCICLSGSIKLVAWDILNKKKTEVFLKNADKSVYIPPNFLLAHQCYSKNCVLLYKWTQYYNGPESQYSVRYDDPTINADWINIKPILSKRDKEAKSLKEI